MLGFFPDDGKLETFRLDEIQWQPASKNASALVLAMLSSSGSFDSLPKDKIIDWSKLKAFADGK